jgi:hypothetical protein
VLELERQLRGLAAGVDWPSTPPLPPRFSGGRRVPRSRLRPLWVAVAAVLIAVAIALSVPQARSAILRVFHLGGVTVQRVRVLPPARERPLAAGLGPTVDDGTARAALGEPVRLPRLSGSPRLHLRAGVVSVLLQAPKPVLLSELRTGGFVLKKIAGVATNVVSLEVGKAPGLWIAGGRHVVVLPAAPARLAGNVLLWQQGTVIYRLEAPDLTKQAALKLAAEIAGT